MHRNAKLAAKQITKAVRSLAISHHVELSAQMPAPPRNAPRVKQPVDRRSAPCSARKPNLANQFVRRQLAGGNVATLKVAQRLIAR